jgi:hypothetical protein
MEDLKQMQIRTILTRSTVGVAVIASGLFASSAFGQESETTIKKTTEPVFRVSRLSKNESATDSAAKSERLLPKAKVDPATERVRERMNVAANPTPTATAPKVAPHPLDRALSFAHDSLNQMRDNIDDYTAIMAKRERVNGKLSKTSYMNVKVRCARTDARGKKAPFSIYMKFLKPREEAGREVLWVDGKYANNLLVHQPGMVIGRQTFELDPNGMLAMKGQKYPIYDAGLENLIVKLIEKASRDRAAGMCKVSYRDGLKLKGRACSLIELVHEEKRAPYEFHKAQVLIDNELNLPVRYTSYDWPSRPGAKPEILEQYTYINIKTNVGLTDKDFSPSNPLYDFPGR